MKFPETPVYIFNREIHHHCMMKINIKWSSCWFYDKRDGDCNLMLSLVGPPRISCESCLMLEMRSEIKTIESLLNS